MSECGGAEGDPDRRGPTRGTADRGLAEQAAQLLTILDMAEEGIVALDHDCRVVFANPRVADLLLLDPAELLGAPVERLLPAIGACRRSDLTTRSEHLLRRHDGTTVWVRVSRRGGISSETAGSVEQVLMLTDISDLKAAEAELVHRSTHDPLTGLANRALLEEWIDDQGPGERTAVVYVDLDGFKDINDTFGHAVGDEMLTVVSARLAANSRVSDMVARLGGDEFIVACTEIHPSDVTTLAERLIRVIGEPAMIGDRIHVVGASAGLATGGHFTGHLGLLQRADAALYRAKAAGGLRVVRDATDPTALPADPAGERASRRDHRSGSRRV